MCSNIALHGCTRNSIILLYYTRPITNLTNIIDTHVLSPRTVRPLKNVQKKNPVRATITLATLVFSTIQPYHSIKKLFNNHRYRPLYNI